jgi:hypothetical protein
MSPDAAMMAGRELWMFIVTPIIRRHSIIVANPTPDPWHFPRDAFAANVLHTLDSGIVNAITLFAPRRMGKTEFVCADLAPLAARGEWLVSYCNLWADKPNPAGVLVAALAAATEPFQPGKKTGKVGVSANLGIVSASAEATQEVAPQAAPSQISEAFAAFAKAIERRARGQRLLLIVDEIQHLATDKRFEPAVAALRTALERHADRIRAVFTGSSQLGLQRLFLDTRAPFFSPGGQLELPRLGAEFVAFMVERANRTFRARVAPAEAAAIFDASGHSPYFLRQAITVARLREVPLARALDLVIEETLNEEGLARRWGRLNAAERSVAMLVFEGKAPFAAASMEQVASDAGREVRSSHVQTTLLRLEREGFVERGMRGGYAGGRPDGHGLDGARAQPRGVEFHSCPPTSRPSTRRPRPPTARRAIPRSAWIGCARCCARSPSTRAPSGSRPTSRRASRTCPMSSRAAAGAEAGTAGRRSWSGPRAPRSSR